MNTPNDRQNDQSADVSQKKLTNSEKNYLTGLVKTISETLAEWRNKKTEKKANESTRQKNINKLKDELDNIFNT